MRSIEARRGAAGPAKASTVRYRVRLSRTGEARRVTHLAQIELIRRAVLASGLPAAVDRRRARPRPRLAFGPAISVGYESLAEYFDLELHEAASPAAVAQGLAGALPGGYGVQGARRIPLFYPSLEASLNVVRYEIGGPFPDGAEGSLRSFLARPEIVLEKVKDGGARVERVEARSLIREMAFLAPDRLGLTLRFGPGRTLKPEAIVREWLGVPQPSAQERAGEGYEPLPGFFILRAELFSETSRGELLAP